MWTHCEQWSHSSAFLCSPTSLLQSVQGNAAIGGWERGGFYNIKRAGGFSALLENFLHPAPPSDTSLTFFFCTAHSSQCSIQMNVFTTVTPLTRVYTLHSERKLKVCIDQPVDVSSSFRRVLPNKLFNRLFVGYGVGVVQVGSDYSKSSHGECIVHRLTCIEPSALPGSQHIHSLSLSIRVVLFSVVWPDSDDMTCLARTSVRHTIRCYDHVCESCRSPTVQHSNREIERRHPFYRSSDHWFLSIFLCEFSRSACLTVPYRSCIHRGWLRQQWFSCLSSYLLFRSTQVNLW